MDRRDLLRTGAFVATAVGLPRWAQAAPSSALEVGYDADARGPTMASDFVGLSFERAQLTNPGYFSTANSGLVRLVRALSPSGNIRIGGSSGEHTDYIGDAARAQPPFEIFGPEHTKTIQTGLFVSTAALHELRGFLDATGWSCLYGLPLAHATPDQAAQEAADVARILGPRLTALQIGNEPDAFRNRFRPADWGPADYLREWDNCHAAIVARVPGVKFAGPDISNKLDYLTAFAEAARRYPDIIMLTGHYYAMGPAGSPDATLDQLKDSEPKTTTLKQSGMDIVQRAVETSRLPFRMAEGNSCWDGGKTGVSDVHAAAIWGADTMLRFAQMGWIGVNWHGGGNGNYSPIVGTPSTGYARRPLYYGTQFAQLLTGAAFLRTTVPSPIRDAGYYALHRQGRDRIVVVNRGDAAIAATLPALPLDRVTILTGPSADARDATRFAAIVQRPARTVTVPPVSAMLFTLPPAARGRG